MANKTKTSITVDKSVKHIKTALYQEELSCDKITGFHLKKTKTGGTWRLRYSDLAKKRKVITLGRFVDGTKDRNEAAELALSYRGKVEDGSDPALEAKEKLQQRTIKHIENVSNTVGAYFYGAYTAHQNRKTDEGKHNLGFIKRHFSDWFEWPMTAINEDHLEKWQLEMEAKGLSHETIKRSFGAFRTMLRHAFKKKPLSNPIASFKLEPPTAAEKAAKNNGSEKKKRRMLTDEELAGINKGANLFNAECIEKLNKPNWQRPIPVWFYPFFRLAAYSGFRTGDIYSLNWNELNLQFRRLIKTPRKTLHHNDPITVDLPLDDGITKVLNDWHAFLGKPTSGLVFPNMQTGLQMDKKTHGKHWKKVLRLGGVKTEIDFYSLRHHYCSKMASSGVPLFEIAKLAGHKSTKMIADHYGHLSANAGKNALAFVSGDFGSPVEQRKVHG